MEEIVHGGNYEGWSLYTVCNNSIHCGTLLRAQSKGLFDGVNYVFIEIIQYDQRAAF